MLSPVQKYCHSKYVFGRNLFVVKCKTSRIYLKYHRCIYIYYFNGVYTSAFDLLVVFT